MAAKLKADTRACGQLRAVGRHIMRPEEDIGRATILTDKPVTPEAIEPRHHSGTGHGGSRYSQGPERCLTDWKMQDGLRSCFNDRFGHFADKSVANVTQCLQND
jgi:hypothetical protein